MLSAVLLTAMLGIGAGDGDQDLVKTLRDAQVSHREAWARGRARVKVTVTKPGVASRCVVQGEILWNDASFILKPVVSDPDDVYFKSAVQFEQEGNLIARGDGFVITYSARQHFLRNDDWAPQQVSVPSLFVLSPRHVFTYCHPPHSDPGRPWEDLIGPSPDLPAVFKASKFIHRKLSSGDIEQTRQDVAGNKAVTVFSARCDMAVASSIGDDPQSTVQSRVEYTYVRIGDRGVLPLGCVADCLNYKTGKYDRFEYEYSEIVMPDTTPASAFTRVAVLDRLERETDYGKRRSRTAKPKVEGATVESSSSESKENRTVKP